MSDFEITIFYSDEDGGYIAEIPELESCSAFGHTPAEALAELERARDVWLAAARAEGKPIPRPRLRVRRASGPPPGDLEKDVFECRPLHPQVRRRDPA